MADLKMIKISKEFGDGRFRSGATSPSKEVCDCAEPRPSTLNMTLPAFAAERGRLQRISRQLVRGAPTQGAQQQTNRMPRCCC